MTDFTEVADRVWVGRYPWWDMNVTLVGGERGLVVVDTDASVVAGRAVLADIRRLGAEAVHAVVTTHWHFDHTFGTAAFREADPHVPVHAHEEAARNLAEWGPGIIDRAAREGGPRCEEFAETSLVIPDRTFSTWQIIDLGDRAVELIHPGRGHTGGDIVVRVPDAGVLLTGDLVEESGPPGLGDDSFPLEWAQTLETVGALATPSTVVVPGHGAPVDADFVSGQQQEIADLAAEIRRLAAAGVPVEDAAREGSWPWPQEIVTAAVHRGYAQHTDPS
ncbi:MAG: MBL fold metallo-hydrolase [Intrasporangiaceae bacterium]|nr:MBL fold metallo-hydrolase [Intrasporangiaceae bacterium]